MRRTLAAVAVMAAAAIFTAEAQAADTISFGEQGSRGSFGANHIVRIDGSITYRNDCPKPGISDWFYPATDVYLVPPGGGTGQLQDVGGGRPNTIVATATAFGDEVIAMTEPSGNLDEGEYDVVYDTCQDGQYDPGFDTIFERAVTVDIPFVVPLADQAIKGLKDESRQEYISWLLTRKAMEGIFKQADKALKAYCKVGNPIACSMKKLDYFDGVKENFLTLLLSQANHYLAIAEDPPDGDFKKATHVAPVDPPRDHSDSAFGNAVADALRPFAGEAAVSAALLRAVERYQGAQVAGDEEWALVHARQAHNLALTLSRIATTSSDALGDLKTVMDAELGDAIEAGREFSRRVERTGLTAEERRMLLNQGMTATQIARFESDIRDVAEDNVTREAVITALDKTRAAHSATATALGTSAADWQAIVTALEAEVDRPAIGAGGPYTTAEGSELSLAGTGSGAAAWDLDGDGEFDDATGLTPTVAFDRAGPYVIGLRAGQDVAYTIVQVAADGGPPVISSPVPAERSVTVTVGTPREFSVTTTGSATWTIDGQAAGSGSSLTYAPAVAQIGSHVIEVTVSGTTRRTWDVVVLDRDSDGDDWTRTTDCDDTDAAIHPTAIERLGNGVDDDCDASTPDAPPGGLTGSMRTWGDNQNGTLGLGSFQPLRAPSPVAIPGLDNVVQVEQGDAAGYAVLDSGEVRAWGANGVGQLGLGTQGVALASPQIPVQVGGGAGRLSGVTQLAADFNGHVLARRTDGTVVAWGENRSGQVGDGSTVHARLYPAQVVKSAGGEPLTGVRAVEAGIAESWALMEDGTVRAWGQIRCDGGNGALRQEPFPVTLPMVGGGVRQVSVGGQLILILKKDGTVLSCGALSPIAGRPVTTTDVREPKPIAGLTDVIDVSAAGGAGLALKEDGSVWLWGANNNGELAVLGLSGTASVTSPTRVPLPPGPPVVDIEMDNACHVLATRADGSLLAWGCDFFEQVGNGPGPLVPVGTPTVIEMPGRATVGSAVSPWNSQVLTRPVADPEWEKPATWVEASVADATTGEAAGGKFKISLSAALPHDVAVDWSLEAGTAGSADLTLGDGTATVPAGATSVEVQVPVLDDALDEDAETFTVRLRDAGHGVQLARSQAGGTIEDDDDAPAIGVLPATVDEGDTSLTDGKLKVRLSKPSGKPVTVKFATADGSATSPADYETATGQLAFAPGQVEAVVHVAVRGDAAVEPGEALSVSLSEPENGTLGDASAPLTITDDEPLALAVTSPRVPEGNGGTTPATFTVALESAPPAGSAVSVDYHVAGVTAGVPGDVAPATGSLTFGPGEKQKQVTVEVKGDTEFEGDEAFRLALSNVVSDRQVLRGESTVATIVDDDEEEPPPPADTVAPVTTATGHPSAWSRQNVTVSLAATDEGSGVKEIAYRIGTVTRTIAGAAASIPVSAEGTTTIAYRAKDNAGNVEAEKTLVVRIDKTAPTVSCTAKPGTLWPADHKLVPITVKVTVTDARSGAAGFGLVSVTSNEPDDASGNSDGATTGDIRDFVPGTADVAGQLRAERSDKGNGRVYTLKYVGRDAAGNERTCTTTVTVPRGCAGAHAARATKEVKQARRRAARRRRQATPLSVR